MVKIFSFFLTLSEPDILYNLSLPNTNFRFIVFYDESISKYVCDKSVWAHMCATKKFLFEYSPFFLVQD